MIDFWLHELELEQGDNTFYTQWQRQQQPFADVTSGCKAQALFVDGGANLGNEVRLSLISDNTKKACDIFMPGIQVVCVCMCVHKLDNYPSGLTFVIHIPIDLGIYVSA